MYSTHAEAFSYSSSSSYVKEEEGRRDRLSSLEEVIKTGERKREGKGERRLWKFPWKSFSPFPSPSFSVVGRI